MLGPVPVSTMSWPTTEEDDVSTTDAIAGWQLDQAGAEAYERELVPRFFDPMAADLVASLDLRTGDRVLDVACGTGIVARHAARRVGPGGQVTAVDVNITMLAVARTATSNAQLPIAFERADATALPLTDATVDAVACQQGVQYFPERSRALAEMRRVAAPGGRLAVSTCRGLEHQPGYRALIDVLTRHVGVTAATVIASPYALGDPDELGDLVRGVGFGDVDVAVHTYDIRFGSVEGFLTAETGSSPLGLLVEQLDADVRSALIGDLAAALAAYSDADGVTFPFQTLLASATR